MSHAELLEKARQAWTGKSVDFVDPHRTKRDALICQVWNIDQEGDPTYVNLVVVSDDPNAHDQYGRQIDRNFTSVPIGDPTNTAGRYFNIK